MIQELSRRERLRAETLAEITELAMAQVAEGGPAALSLNAIAKQMRMSGPAIYRYFASRDELLKQLVVDAYGDLAETLAHALQQARRKRPDARFRAVADAYGDLAETLAHALEQARRKRPDARFRAVADAYRGWALEHPGHYPLLLGGGLARGDQPPEIAIASQRAMEHMLSALRDLAADGPSAPGELPRNLDAQLRSWAHDRGAADDLPPWLLRLAIVAWQRLHGHIELELEGVHSAMGISSDALYRTEVDALIAEATDHSPTLVRSSAIRQRS